MDYEQLGHILESIHPGVTIADSSGVFRFVSNSYLSGRSVKGSDIIGKFAGSEEMMKMFSPCVTQMVFESHKRVTTVQKGVDNEETFVTGIPVFKDGELEMIISYSSWEITGFGHTAFCAEKAHWHIGAWVVHSAFCIVSMCKYILEEKAVSNTGKRRHRLEK